MKNIIQESQLRIICCNIFCSLRDLRAKRYRIVKKINNRYTKEKKCDKIKSVCKKMEKEKPMLCVMGRGLLRKGWLYEQYKPDCRHAAGEQAL